MASKSERKFNRFLEKTTRDAKDAVAACVDAFLSSQPNNRAESARIAYQKVCLLTEILDLTECPDWLRPMNQTLYYVSENAARPESVERMRDLIERLLPAFRRHEWNLDVSSPGINFDGIFEQYRAECRIPELFDEVIKCLKEIVISGEIDSIKAIEELNEVIATLQNARDGSYLATRLAWEFLVTWFKNSAWELAGSLPGVGSILKGLKKTIEEGDPRMQALHEKMHAALKEKVATNFPRIEYRPLQLPAPPTVDDKPESEDD